MRQIILTFAAIPDKMYFRGIILFLALFTMSNLVAQVTFKNSEFSIANENDVYLLLDNDKYYSNGIITHYRWVPKEIPLDSVKKILDIELSQKFFTPQDLNLLSFSNYDRPYAGLLYGGFSINTFKEENRRSMIGIELGVVGRGSGAQGFQEWYHDVFGFPKPQGWEFQIPNEIVFNLRSEFNRQFILKPSQLDVISSTELSLGTAFTHGVQRLDLRLGKLQSLRNSSFKNAMIGRGSEVTPRHNYFFLGYGLQYVLHNITINGSIWNSEAPHTEIATPWVRHLRFGWVSNSDKATFKITYNWSSPEVSGIRRHAYLGLELLLRFPPKSE